MIHVRQDNSIKIISIAIDNNQVFIIQLILPLSIPNFIAIANSDQCNLIARKKLNVKDVRKSQVSI